jgi:hypothetical protein
MKYLSFKCYIDDNSEYFTLELMFIDLRTADKKFFDLRKKIKQERKEIKMFQKIIILLVLLS